MGPTMGDFDDPDPAGPLRRRGLGLGIVAAVLALVVGLVVGFVVGGGTSRDTSVASVETAPETAPAPTAARAAAPASQACRQAGAAGAAVQDQLRQAVQAMGALDPAELRRILDRLQPLQVDLEAAVASCGAA